MTDTRVAAEPDREIQQDSTMATQRADDASPAPSASHSSSQVSEPKMNRTEAEDFKPSKRLYVAFLTLAVITLMVALDGTSLSVALPV